MRRELTAEEQAERNYQMAFFKKRDERPMVSLRLDQARLAELREMNEILLCPVSYLAETLFDVAIRQGYDLYSRWKAIPKENRPSFQTFLKDETEEEEPADIAA